jgi:hypothetical protein
MGAVHGKSSRECVTVTVIGIVVRTRKCRRIQKEGFSRHRRPSFAIQTEIGKASSNYGRYKRNVGIPISGRKLYRGQISGIQLYAIGRIVDVGGKNQRSTILDGRI